MHDVEQGAGPNEQGDGADSFLGLAEVAAAADTIAGLLVHGTDVDVPTQVFRQALVAGLSRKYAGHWWTDEPSRGEGYRHVMCGRKYVDSVVSEALHAAGIPLNKLTAMLPADLSVWCDPGMVTTRMGRGELRTSQIGGGQWTPPVSPALSVSAREFKPSPPGSPVVSSPLSRHQGDRGAREPQTGHQAQRTPSGRSTHYGGDMAHTPRFTAADAMTPPFARMSEPSPMGYYQQQHHQTPVNFYQSVPPPPLF
eukprot:m.160548 g.160548  ORF g.160548 m.160548 type:complete len:253 (-) comp11958_c0_seq1:21-779(-)